MGNTLPPHRNICLICNNYKGTRLIEIGDEVEENFINFCSAFNDGIPYEILTGENDHTKPYKGDNGITFDPIEDD